MLINHKLVSQEIPDRLRKISPPPKQLFVSNKHFDELLKSPAVAIVGSRKISPYGRFVTEKLANELARQGVVIVSGLAIGVDACAHQAALDSSGTTIAVLPTSLDNIQPAMNRKLALNITQNGGALISEYPPKTPVNRAFFVARNRLVTGLADAVIITEAAQRSGTMSTANYARKQNKPLFAVPGNINNPLSFGPNWLIKEGLAKPITESKDILSLFNIGVANKNTALELHEKNEVAIIRLIKEGLSDGHDLQRQSKLTTEEFNQVITMLEISGYIKNSGNNTWSL